MMTIEQLEKLMPIPDEQASKQEMSNELLATLGIKPVKGNDHPSDQNPLH
jgi:hypothetical protein